MLSTRGLGMHNETVLVFCEFPINGIGISQTSFKTSRLHAAPSASRGVLSLSGGNK